MPHNADYLILGLLAVVGTLGLYAVMLVGRFRAALRDRRTLEQLAHELDPTPRHTAHNLPTVTQKVRSSS